MNASRVGGENAPLGRHLSLKNGDRRAADGGVCTDAPEIQGGRGNVGPGTDLVAVPKTHLKIFQTDPGN